MFGKKQNKSGAREVDLPPDLDPKSYSDVMTALRAVARAVAELREEVRKR